MALAEKSLFTTIPEAKRGFEFGGEVRSRSSGGNASTNRSITLLVGSLRLHEKRDFKWVCLHNFFFVAKLLLIQCL